jgi:chaperonin cofactor prefoldin
MSNPQFELQRLQNEIEEQVQKYNDLDKKSQQLVQTRSSLYEQESENSLVLREIDILAEGTPVNTQTRKFSSRLVEF